MYVSHQPFHSICSLISVQASVCTQARHHSLYTYSPKRKATNLRTTITVPKHTHLVEELILIFCILFRHRSSSDCSPHHTLSGCSRVEQRTGYTSVCFQWKGLHGSSVGTCLKTHPAPLPLSSSHIDQFASFPHTKVCTLMGATCTSEASDTISDTQGSFMRLLGWMEPQPIPLG